MSKPKWGIIFQKDIEIFFSEYFLEKQTSPNSQENV